MEFIFTSALPTQRSEVPNKDDEKLHCFFQENLTNITSHITKLNSLIPTLTDIFPIVANALN